MFLKVKDAGNNWIILNVRKIAFVIGADYFVSVTIEQLTMRLGEYKMDTIEMAIERALEKETTVIHVSPDR